MDDLQAIRRLKAGDLGGLETLIARYQEKALRTAYLVTRQAPLAEEVVQDTFIRFYEHAQRFDEGRSFEAYFLRMVVYAALNRIEREKRTAASFEETMDLNRLESLMACASSVEEQVELTQLKVEIHQALGVLPARQRAAAVQRYYLDMSEAEMSAALEVPPGTVKWLLHAARTRLRSLLGSQRSEE